MGDQLNALIAGMGVIAETSAILRDLLIKNGFSREEAIELCKIYISTITSTAANNSSAAN